MTLAAIAMLCISTAAVFDVQAVPLGNPQALAFFAHADADATADLFVLSGNALNAYPSARRGSQVTVKLLEGTSAIDVADIDGDGQNEVVGICGERILCYPIPREGKATAPRELFRLVTQLSGQAPEPCLHVMVVKRGDLILLALPCENTFELRGVDGELVQSYPIGPDAPQRVSFGNPFSCCTVHPPQIGRPGSLEMRVSRVLEFEPELPADLLPVEIQGPRRRRGTPSQARDAVDLDDASWPWFPLKTQGPASDRALYALARPDFRNTLIRIRECRPGGSDTDRKSARTGPKRMYPGAIVLVNGDLPDFNNDGYVDLILWKTPEPAASVDSITRVLMEGSWPVELTTHLFSHEKGRYEPLASGCVKCNVPVVWFLTMESDVPLRHWILSDFNGDGRTDLGCSTAPDRFSVWLYRERGFAARPDYTQRFPGPLVALDFHGDLDGSGRTSLALRTKHALYLLHADSEN